VGNTAQIKEGAIFPSYPFSADQDNVVQEALETKGGEADMKISFDGISASIRATATAAAVPGRLRVSDIDQDGYPDFVMTLKFRDETD